MVKLKPALESRGFEVAVFHATGMGGRAFEALAQQRAFACVFDFCSQELGNHIHGSNISAGADRLTNAGRSGIPQLVAPGCYDLVDIVGWHDSPEKWQDNPTHAHNRLLTSVILNDNQRREVARAHSTQLSTAESQTVLLLPLGGAVNWIDHVLNCTMPMGWRHFVMNCENPALRILRCMNWIASLTMMRSQMRQWLFLMIGVNAGLYPLNTDTV